MPPSLAERLRPPAEVVTPPAHLGLTWGRLRPDDAPEAAELVERCVPVDEPVHAISPGQLRHVLEVAAETERADVVGGRDADGALQAAAWVLRPEYRGGVAEAYVTATIAPAWRGRGIGRALLTWQDGRARQLLAALGRDTPCRIGAHVDAHATERRRLYVAAGFSLRSRLAVMRTSASGLRGGAHAGEAGGARLVPYSPELDARIAGAGLKRWGTVATYATTYGVEPRWSVVALDGDDVVGVALSHRRPADWSYLGFTEGFVEHLAVAPGRDDLAHTILAAVAGALAADGIASLGVEVDAIGAAAAELRDAGFEASGERLLFTIEV